jgi:hypothetical protein
VRTPVILEELSREGVKVWAEGERLRYRGPKRVLTPDVLERLLAHKSEILAYLQPARPKRPPMRDGIYYHGPECDCEWCFEDAELIRTGRIQSERQVFELAREHFGGHDDKGAA